MRLRLLVLAAPAGLLLLLDGCAERTRGGVPAPSVAAEEHACATAEDARACADSVERVALAAAAGRAVRRGDTLWIHPEHAAPVRLANDTSDADRWVTYRYDAHLADVGYHLVSAHFYEGGEYLLVDGATGRTAHLAARPVLSPRRTRFAVASADLWALYDANVLQVWRFTDGAPELEWGLDGGEAWGASDAVWVSESELHFTRHQAETSFEDARQTRMRLRITDGGGIEILPWDG